MRPPSPIAGRRPRARTLWVLLGLLALRAVVPAGYMLAAADGHMRLVLCDAAASAPAHQHAGHRHPGAGHTHPDPTCPFAQSAGPAPPPALPALQPVAPLDRTVLPGQSGQTHATFGPTRQHAPRAPPQLA